MTERLADIRARVEGMRQLGGVVNAMRGIAAARAQQARSQLVAVDSYAATIARAIGRVQTSAARRPVTATRESKRQAVVVFCAEQGFAGAFSEHVLDSIRNLPPQSNLFLIGTRGRALADERGLLAGWYSAMPSQSLGIPKLADRICDAVYTRIAAGSLNSLDAVFAECHAGDAMSVVHRRLLPLAPSDLPHVSDGNVPLQNLPSETLLATLTDDYLHAQLCHSALHAFAAENEVRMRAMAAAHSHIEHKLVDLRANERLVRQEEITEEIIELVAGQTAQRH